MHMCPVTSWRTGVGSFNGDNKLEARSGPDQDFHIMVLVLVRKKTVDVGEGLGERNSRSR